jgi:DNA-binding LacI/PurR family transcriptional regulator
MNIREVARRAGVSTATVSRAINRIATVDPRLAKRVLKVVDQLGYYPNTQARALVLGKTRIFGLIVSDITNPFFPEIVQSFENIAVQHNYEILLSSTVDDPKRMELSVRRMIERRVDGVAVLTFGIEEVLIEHLRFRKLPRVFVDLETNADGVSNIRIDYLHGIRQAVQHLAALRHEHIAFISGPPELKSAQARKAAFEESMREIGLTVRPEFIVVGNHTMEGGMGAQRELAALAIPPSAIICSNDMSAIGVLRAAFESGIAIPRDLSLVGFDDIRLAQFTTPPLTTVQMSQMDLANLAFQALIDETNEGGKSPARKHYSLMTNLVLRSSTALAPIHGRRPQETAE